MLWWFALPLLLLVLVAVVRVRSSRRGDFFAFGREGRNL